MGLLHRGEYFVIHHKRKGAFIVSLSLAGDDLVLEVCTSCPCTGVPEESFDDCPLCSSNNSGTGDLTLQFSRTSTSNVFDEVQDHEIDIVDTPPTSLSLSSSFSSVFQRSNTSKSNANRTTTKRYALIELLETRTTTDHYLFGKGRGKNQSKRKRECPPGRGLLLVFRRRVIALEAMSQGMADRWCMCLNWARQRLGDGGVSSPFNLQHVAHVDLDLQWANKGLESLFLHKKLIGVGGHGSVYLVEDSVSGMVFAAKSVGRGSSDRKEEEKKKQKHKQKKKRRIKGIERNGHTEGNSNTNSNSNTKSNQVRETEAQQLKKLRHPNIVQFYGEWGPDSQGEVWLLMDYCRLGSLGGLMRGLGCCLTEAQVAWVVLCTLKGLVYLHGNGVLHRDIKPGNILVEVGGIAKIGDFGEASQLRRSVSVVKDKRFRGTPLYLAPETVRRGETRKASDIWALGVTAIELATGRNPYEELVGFAGLAAIQSGEVPELPEGGGRVWSKGFRDVLGRMLKENVEERESAEELLEHEWVKRAGVGCMGDLVRRKAGSMGEEEGRLLLEEYSGILGGSCGRESRHRSVLEVGNDNTKKEKHRHSCFNFYAYCCKFGRKE